MSQGSREPTAKQKWASPSSPLMFLEESELHYSLMPSNFTATTIKTASVRQTYWENFDDVEATTFLDVDFGKTGRRKLQKQDSHIPTLYS